MPKPTLYRAIPHPKDEDWRWEDNPDWIMLEPHGPDATLLVPVEPCEHGHSLQHIVDFWWRNTSNAGARWCDGKASGLRRDIEEHEWDPRSQTAMFDDAGIGDVDAQ